MASFMSNVTGYNVQDTLNTTGVNVSIDDSNYTVGSSSGAGSDANGASTGSSNDNSETIKKAEHAMKTGFWIISKLRKTFRKKKQHKPAQ